MSDKSNATWYINKKERDKKYIKEQTKQVSLNIRPYQFMRLKEYAEQYGYTITGLIKESLAEKLGEPDLFNLDAREKYEKRYGIKSPSKED